MLVKVCGIANTDDALMVLDAGADALGVIIDVPVETPRKITVEKALEIKEAVKDRSHTFITVLMPDKIDDVVNIVDEIEPNGIQLHGDETPEFIKELKESINAYIIKAIHIQEKPDMEYIRSITEHADMILTDTKIGEQVGGTGKIHDWDIDLKIEEEIDKPLILSGGLNPDNVGDAIDKVNPYAVDVSSGVESSPGIKDPKKVKKLIRNVDEKRQK